MVASTPESQCNRWRGKTPLHHAAMNGHFKTYVAFATGTCWKRCTGHPGWDDIVEFRNLARTFAGAPSACSWRVHTNQGDNNGQTPLHAAAQGDPVFVHSLFKAGAKKNLADSLRPSCILQLGTAIIILSVFWLWLVIKIKLKVTGRARCILLLGEVMYLFFACCSRPTRAHIELRTGDAPLHFAVAQGHIDVVRLLVDAGANANLASSNGQTSLHIAAQKGNVDAVHFLVAAGANTNQTDNKGKIPLHRAVAQGHLDVVRTVIEAGSDINLTEKKGKAPLALAAAKGHWDLVRLLIAAGADPDLSGKRGKTSWDCSLSGWGWCPTASILGTQYLWFGIKKATLWSGSLPFGIRATSRLLHLLSWARWLYHGGKASAALRAPVLSGWLLFFRKLCNLFEFGCFV